MRRGQFIVVLSGFAVLAALAAPAAAQTVVKIGVINSNSGFLAQPGDEMEKGMALYVKEHEKDLPPGVKVELLRRDDAAAPETGKRVAQELITRDRVQMLVGVVSSPVAAAIAPLTAEAKIPFIITNAAGVAIPRISPYLVRVSFTQWHTVYPLGKWTAQQGWKKGFSAVSDFIPGHDAEAAFVKSFTDAGRCRLRIQSRNAMSARRWFSATTIPPVMSRPVPTISPSPSASPPVVFSWALSWPTTSSWRPMADISRSKNQDCCRSAKGVSDA